VINELTDANNTLGTGEGNQTLDVQNNQLLDTAIQLAEQRVYSPRKMRYRASASQMLGSTFIGSSAFAGGPGSAMIHSGITAIKSGSLGFSPSKGWYRLT
jgi:hypothetical protein